LQACTDCDLHVEKQQAEDHFFWWIIGIALLTGALLLSARMGIYQESIYKKYGKYPEEALYYTVKINIVHIMFFYFFFFVSAHVLHTRLSDLFSKYLGTYATCITI
jgi:hypothetical protein